MRVHDLILICSSRKFGIYFIVYTQVTAYRSTHIKSRLVEIKCNNNFTAAYEIQGVNLTLLNKKTLYLVNNGACLRKGSIF